VSKVDSHGNVTRTYKEGTEQLNRPRNVTVDSEGQVLVADNYGDRVVGLGVGFPNELDYDEHVNIVFYVSQTNSPIRRSRESRLRSLQMAKQSRHTDEC
jgi:hypothetical protein